jgi:DNA-binding response OmpR family regulator
VTNSRTPVGKRILVVEDDPETLNVIHVMLGSQGYIVETLSNGKKIISNQVDLPDLYIVDKFLPFIDGLDICLFLKSQEATMNIPVIMISVKPLQREASAVGVDAFIQKPFAMNSFLNSVSAALKQ